ncbi:PQQ-binding-like beta-propeller repeat protein [Flavobacterium sp. GA093]|uniref:PQQ-binding-like beta-propeller repeat protein n=1 Tax=Flavobacterium hydrocarbonoxydans TaxID=2683249 RepID=A0A6I4NNQ4_9FLAO|nr:PQQ-binding-like beta-propeller repeat protein [Flavobacterium hydrocarbonoxydans]MWB94185.1 PQQ-binding-like beta-propeller repeat protein [Flavobacterium hydrocarbonoxydans]
MKKRIYLLSFLSLSLFTFCEKNDDLTDDNQSQTDNNIEISNDVTTLNKRLDYTNSGVISIVNSSSTRKMASATANDFPLVQIAEVNPPTDSNGRTLQANHVAVNGNFAYVAYTMKGNVYSGAIDVIDVSDPYKPKLITSALITDTDITSLTYSNGKLIIAGATSMDKNPTLTSPSIVINMQLSSGVLTENYTVNQLEGQVTTDVAANSTSYFAVTGDAGSLFKIDANSKQVIGKTTLEDLRSLAINGDKIVTLSGTKGINIYNSTTLNLQKSFTTSTDVSGAKRTIDFDGQKLLVAEGYNGLGAYDINSGSKLQAIPLVNAGGDNVTNAVSVNEGYVFVANGAAGLNVYETGTQLNLLGTVAIEGSSNYVKSSGDFIYVASGKGGLKIIKMEKPDSNFLNCESYPAYNQGQDLILNSNEVKSFSGSTAINSIIVNSGGILNHCGSITVQNNLILNSGGTFNMRGTLAQGKYQQSNPTELIINSNAILQVEGTVVIWGDLRLNSGAKINFIGNNSSITIYGKVTKGSNITITGNYTDTENKLK